MHWWQCWCGWISLGRGTGPCFLVGVLTPSYAPYETNNRIGLKSLALVQTSLGIDIDSLHWIHSWPARPFRSNWREPAANEKVDVIGVENRSSWALICFFFWGGGSKTWQCLFVWLVPFQASLSAPLYRRPGRAVRVTNKNHLFLASRRRQWRQTRPTLSRDIDPLGRGPPPTSYFTHRHPVPVSLK